MKTTIILYNDHIVYPDGIFRWIINFCNLLSDKYDITIVSKIIRPDLNDILTKQGIKTEMWKSDNTYFADILLLTLDFVRFPDNIISKKKFKIIHCNYLNISNNFINLDDGSEFIAVSKQAAEGFTKQFNLPCKDISSFVLPHRLRSVLRLISCSRVYPNKGFERMNKLANQLYELGFAVQWNNYSELDSNGIRFLNARKPKHINFMPGIDHDLLLDLISDSDYLVQLSDNEGFCYAVHESLMLGTPVITTDIDAFKYIVTNGINGYKLPIDMDYGITTLYDIVFKIPKDFTYDNKINDILSQWKEVLQV